jgi:hypothetical protein
VREHEARQLHIAREQPGRREEEQVADTARLSYQVMGTWIYCWLYYIRG